MTSLGRSRTQFNPEAPVEQRFRWSVADVPQILTETGPDGEADFVYGYDRILAGTATGSEAFSLDLYGSTIATPPTRAWARARGYDVFGAASAPGPDHADPAFGYRGELTIGDDIYLRARTYDPDTGRFTSPDSLDGVPGEAVAANPYHRRLPPRLHPGRDRHPDQPVMHPVLPLPGSSQDLL